MISSPTGSCSASIILRPTTAVTIEQIMTNSHHAELSRAVLAADHTLLLKASRSDFASLAEYERAKARYAGGTPIAPGQIRLGGVG